MSLSETANLTVQIGLKDNFSAGLRRAKGGLSGFSGVLPGLSRGLSNLAHNLTRIAKYGVLAVGAAMTYSLKAAGDYQAALQTINTVAFETPQRLSAIGEGMRTMARATGTSLSELTAAYYDLVSAGIKTSDAQNVLTQANTLAIGGLSTTKQAVDLLTTAINAYGGDASKAAVYANDFAQAIAAGKVTAAQIAESFANIGLLAAHYKIGVDEISAAYGTLTSQGMAADNVSIYMRQTLNSLVKQTPALALLEHQTGKNYLAIAGSHGLVYALQQMVTDANKSGVSLADLTGRIQAQQFIVAVTGDKFAQYQAQLDLVHKSSDGAGMAAQQMAERQKGLNFQLDRLKATAKDTAITFGLALMPAVTKIAAKINDLVTAHQGDITKFAGQLGDLANRLFTDKNMTSGIENGLKFLRDLPWDSIKSSMKFTADVAKSMIDTFNRLPPSVQGGLITLLAANKLTGGVVGEGLKGLMGMVFSGLRTITAGSVTVIGGSVTGGVPGVTPGGSGVGAGLKGLGTTIIAGVAGGLILDTAVTDLPPAFQSAIDMVKGNTSQSLVDMQGIEKSIFSSGLDLAASITGSGKEVAGSLSSNIFAAAQREVDAINANAANVTQASITTKTAIVRAQLAAALAAVKAAHPVVTGLVNLRTAANQATHQSGRTTSAVDRLTGIEKNRKTHITVQNTIRTTLNVSATQVAVAVERLTGYRGFTPS